MKRTIIISVILIACTTCFAAEPTAYVDNFVYTLDYAHQTAEVAANPKASGDIIIPEQIKDGEGKTYTVTSLSAEAFKGCKGVTSMDPSSSLPNSTNPRVIPITYTGLASPLSTPWMKLSWYRTSPRQIRRWIPASR